MISATKIPKRIVLSRKGFDSATGGCASPILDGKLISLPIPEIHAENGQLRYEELPKKQGEQIADLVNQLTKKKKETIEGSHLVHLDPDLRVELRDEQHAHLPFTFGQSGPSQN
jgi:phage pi2 protein 07